MQKLRLTSDDGKELIVSCNTLQLSTKTHRPINFAFAYRIYVLHVSTSKNSTQIILCSVRVPQVLSFTKDSLFKLTKTVARISAIVQIYWTKSTAQNNGINFNIAIWKNVFSERIEQAFHSEMKIMALWIWYSQITTIWDTFVIMSYLFAFTNIIMWYKQRYVWMGLTYVLDNKTSVDAAREMNCPFQQDASGWTILAN